MLICDFTEILFTALLGSRATLLAFLGPEGITVLGPSFKEGKYPFSLHMLVIPWARLLSKLKLSKLKLNFTQICQCHWGQ